MVWQSRIDRLAMHIATSGPAPDIISMTESSGWIDFNALVGESWPSGTTQVFTFPKLEDGTREDVMAVAVGDGSGPLPPAHRLRLTGAGRMPNQVPCRPSALAFSDHCGAVVRFSE